MTYGSVCSGIESASIAWEPLGWQPAWFAEIEPSPSAVLAYRWPKVANMGDMCKLPEDCPDGPRYKAIGNSKAVPVIKWIGERIHSAIN